MYEVYNDVGCDGFDVHNCYGNIFCPEGASRDSPGRVQDDLETYCKNVTPGEQRILACLYAHEDKLSGRCVYALYNAT